MAGSGYLRGAAERAGLPGWRWQGGRGSERVGGVGRRPLPPGGEALGDGEGRAGEQRPGAAAPHGGRASGAGRSGLPAAQPLPPASRSSLSGPRRDLWWGLVVFSRVRAELC